MMLFDYSPKPVVKILDHKK